LYLNGSNGENNGGQAICYLQTVSGNLKGIDRHTVDCFKYGTLQKLVDQNNNNLIVIEK
jgi:hypothetical protein